MKCLLDNIADPLISDYYLSRPGAPPQLAGEKGSFGFRGKFVSVLTFYFPDEDVTNRLLLVPGLSVPEQTGALPLHLPLRHRHLRPLHQLQAGPSVLLGEPNNYGSN